MNLDDVLNEAERQYKESGSDKTSFNIFMSGFKRGAIWRGSLEAAQKEIEESEPSASNNTGQLAIALLDEYEKYRGRFHVEGLSELRSFRRYLEEKAQRQTG